MSKMSDLGLARVRFVLLDAREHPVEVAGHDARLAIFAISRHAHAERRAALRAGWVAACTTLRLAAADERPVFGVGAFAVAASGEERPVVAERVVEARREDANGD